jgi:hypothetical protein
MLSLHAFRDAISKLSLRKKLTILASVGVLLPVLVLTYLQYRSLTELQNNTKGAFKDNLRQGLTYVEQQMKQRLENIAAQTLNPVGRMHAEELEKHFANVKRSHPEIEQIFVYSGDQTPPDILSPFNRARMTQSFVDADRRYLFVPGMDKGAYLFYPLPDQRGFAGVLLSERFVSDDLLVGSINKVSKYISWEHCLGATLLVLGFLFCGMALIIRATDREARLAQAKSNFVSNVSHELKTPLSLLSLFSEILELGRVNSEEKKTEYYRIIRHESLRLNKMIDNIQALRLLALLTTTSRGCGRKSNQTHQSRSTLLPFIASDIASPNKEISSETKRFVNHRVSALDSLLNVSPRGRHRARLRKGRAVKPDCCAHRCPLAVRSACACRTPVRIHHQSTAVALWVDRSHHPHEGKRCRPREQGCGFERSILLRMDADRDQCDRALLHRPLGAWTVEFAVAAFR